MMARTEGTTAVLVRVFLLEQPEEQQDGPSSLSFGIVLTNLAEAWSNYKRDRRVKRLWLMGVGWE